MKKYLFVLIFTLSFFIGIIGVNAQTITYKYDYAGDDSDDVEAWNILKDNFTQDKDIIRKMFDDMYSYYLENYKDIYPYYYIFLYGSDTEDSSDYIMEFVLHNFSPIFNMKYYILSGTNLYVFSTFDSNLNLIPSYTRDNIGYIRYSYSDGTYNLPFIEEYDVLPNNPNYMFSDSGWSTFNTIYKFFYSNVPFNFYSENSDDKLVISNYAFTGESKTINVGDHIPLLQEDMGLDIINDYNSSDSSYIDVDLNKYSYVALSLKDYNVENFESVMYVKGQLCPTQVYNYGMTSKDSYQNGTQISSRCNIAYDDFTPVRFYVSDLDLINHSIYYLKAYNTSIENKIKIDSNIFNIHYISDQEKDNPILNINGRNYSTIPYDELPSTATKNEEENYVPGESEQITFESFFDKPLEALKSVWGAIVSIFSIIGEFIILLPPTMQGFLYISFGIAIVLGIIKILL